MNKNHTRITFTDSVKAVQEAQGSRQSYQKMETSGDRYRLNFEEANFIEQRDGFYLSTINENGWPYVQFRGGPKGFVKVIDRETLLMADFGGNRQYLSTGNINSSHKAMLFFMDYPNQHRLKIWAEADVLSLDEHPNLLKKVNLPNYKAKIERILRFKIQAFDWNCQQHITPRYTIDEFRALQLAAQNSD